MSGKSFDIVFEQTFPQRRGTIVIVRMLAGQRDIGIDARVHVCREPLKVFDLAVVCQEQALRFARQNAINSFVRFWRVKLYGR